MNLLRLTISSSKLMQHLMTFYRLLYRGENCDELVFFSEFANRVSKQ